MLCASNCASSGIFWNVHTGRAIEVSEFALLMFPGGNLFPERSERVFQGQGEGLTLVHWCGGFLKTC